MRDIVERLRWNAVSTPELSLLGEAADEIEKLRQQVAKLSSTGHNEVVSERYDIRFNFSTRKWEVVDTANRYAPTGHDYVDRIDALNKAKQMDGAR